MMANWHRARLRFSLRSRLRRVRQQAIGNFIRRPCRLFKHPFGDVAPCRWSKTPTVVAITFTLQRSLRGSLPDISYSFRFECSIFNSQHAILNINTQHSTLNSQFSTSVAFTLSAVENPDSGRHNVYLRGTLC